MEPAQVFGAQFFGSLVLWWIVVSLWIGPAVRDWSDTDRLALWTTPLVLRYLGLGLLVPQLAPGLDADFSRNTAIGDAATSVLAVVAVVGLRRGFAPARAFAFAAHLVGSIDLCIALPHAVLVGAATHLHGQWFVPAVIVPLMIHAHVMGWRTLLRR